MTTEESFTVDDSCDIAIIGIAGRFPKANNIEMLWENLKNGVEGISFFKDEELEVANLTPDILSSQDFIKAKGVLDDVELFDASFFNIPAREAEWMDPQHRLMLECAWTALEDAACDPETYQGSIAVYAGSGAN